MDISQTMYYGVHVPNTDSHAQPPEHANKQNVFFDKTEALKEVKKCKKARFKAFQFFHEALEFSLHGSECPNNNSSSADINPFKNGDVVHSVGERPSQFRGPKSQDLVKLRKAIEVGDVDFVRTTIWDNPRYLISNGDTPAILQEGSRYNAVHVAAKAKNAQMCQLILSTINNPEFLQLLYGEENHMNAEDASKILLDLYLNTPDKGLNETPLHFAVKFGAVEVVEILVSYSVCDKNVFNKYSHMPKDMICNRVTNPSVELVEQIASLLLDQFYVPVLRSEDNSIQPMIGEPFSPASPPRLNTNPIDPRIEIHAFAGPMKKDAASVFHKKWKTPPRVRCSPNRSICDSYRTETDIRLQDTEKGLERVGRDLANVCNVAWKEYWPFLDSFADLRTRDGLQQLELYLKRRFLGIMPQMMKPTGRENHSALSPITELCQRFGACTLEENDRSVGRAPCLCIEKSCQVLSNRIALYITNQMDGGVAVTKHTLEAFEAEIKHLRSLINSFMDDPTFGTTVNYQSVHSRIAYLVANVLKRSLSLGDNYKASLELVRRKYREYDDDATTTDSSQVLCLVERILTSLKSSEYRIDESSDQFLSEKDCVRLWSDASPCHCLWNRLDRMTNAHNKNKFIAIKSNRSLDNVSRRLTFFDDDDSTSNDLLPNNNGLTDEFHSMDNSSDSDSDDLSFEDAEMSDYIDVYIDGNTPTKMDYAVFNVLHNVAITPEEYPHVYRWRHSMKLFPEDEKHRWPSPCVSRIPMMSTPQTDADGKRHISYTSPQSWLRVTGENSPIRSLKAFKQSINLLYDF